MSGEFNYAFCEEANLVKKPIDLSTGKEYDKCEYALFTGCGLGASEPELVVKLFDSFRFQHPDTGVILMCCGFVAQMAGKAGSELTGKTDISVGESDGATVKGNYTEMDEMPAIVRTAWEELGKPKLVCSCPTCIKTLNKELPEIPTVSLYDLLIELGISGGCHEETYCIWEKADSKEYEIIKAIAEDMGVTIVAKPDAPIKGATVVNNAPSAPADNAPEGKPPALQPPYLTCNINVRNMLKSQGKEAVHILELIYGMGDSNAHMIHEQKLQNRIELKEAMLSLFW